MSGPAGGKARTDRRDALFLARMLAVGNIVKVAVPTPGSEAPGVGHGRRSADSPKKAGRHFFAY